MYHVCYTLVLLPHSKAAGTQHINGPNFNVLNGLLILLYIFVTQAIHLLSLSPHNINILSTYFLFVHILLALTCSTR